MTHDDHQRERMRHWVRWTDETSVYRANARLAEFDKRFPAPSAAAPVEPVTIRDTRLRVDIPAAELASLRQKARLWDAVASGKLGIYPRDGDFAVHWDVGHSMKATAEEAVEAAIAAGALK